MALLTRSRAFRSPALVAVAACVLAAAAPAEAQGRRARLSEDLSVQVAAGSSTIDVIVHGTRADVDALARKYNLRVKRYMRSGAVLRVTAGQLEALQQDETQEHLSADVPIRSIADVTAETIGADQVWAGSESVPALSGAGVTVAVIDSGVDPKHAALRGRVAYSVDFTGGDGIDRFGHGTHVAALIAGRPVASGGQEYRGIASNARIINLRVLGDDGSGMSSDVIEAIDWAVENRKKFDIGVINLSLGAPVTQPYRDDPMCEAVQRAVAAGIIVVAAAGNYGLNAEGKTVYGSISTPGNDPNVITVGALDTHDTAVRSDDTVARFSSRGPTRFDLVLKPDLVAPGTRVVSAEAAGSYLSKTYSQRHVSGSGATAYMQLSGTSMAAGVVSGTVALLLEGRPKLTPRVASMIFHATSDFLPLEGLIAGGAGSLDVYRAADFLQQTNKVGTAKTIAFEELSRERVASTRLWTGRTDEESGDALFVSGNQLVKFGIVLAARKSETIVWGTNGDTIVWGTGRTIVWGTSADTIIWGTSHDTIVWGTSLDTIVWGTTVDTIVWGTGVSPDTIVWGTSPDTIVWGTGTLETLE
jgi:serine protease AprX